MAAAAKRQKLRSEVKELRPPNAKASVLVSEVIVMDGPACCIAFLIRTAADSFRSV